MAKRRCGAAPRPRGGGTSSEAERIVRATLDSLSAHIALVDASGRIFLTNEAWRSFARSNGTSPSEVSEGANYLEVCDAAVGAEAEEARAFAEGLRSVLGGRLKEFAMEYPCHSPTKKRWFVARVSRFLAGGVLEGAVVAHEDVTERKLAEEAMAHLALHDPLTDLPNRRLLADRLEQALSRAERDGSAVAVLYLDLEGFKSVNDEFGHEAGDRLLVAVAGRLKGCLREADTAARLGGDEFVVVLEGVGGEGEALALSERIGRALAEPFSVWGTERTLKASIGTALNTRPHERPEELMRKADLAMYRSKKREGKDPPHPSRPPPDESAFS
jgi:diguanylate cyclase (GGDEF)-like protein